MKKVFLSVLLVALLAYISVGQDEQKAACPSISVMGPAGVVEEGETIRFVGRIDSKRPMQNVKYTWTVNNGNIVKGQGTLKIDVLHYKYLSNLTGTLTVTGLPDGCSNWAAESMSWETPPQAKKLDEFVGPLDKVVASRFESIRRLITDSPNAQVYIFLTGSDPVSIKAKRSVLANEIIVRHHEFRVTFIDVGFKDDRVGVWLVPPGAALPNPNEWTPDSKDELTCPKISVTAPAGIPRRGEPITFIANVLGELPKDVFYRWSISEKGEIADGQETLVLRAWMPDDGSNLTATLEILGLQQGCPTTFSETVGFSHGGGMFAKPKPAMSCPLILVEGPASLTRPGDRMKVRVKTDPDYAASTKLGYLWSVDAGRIDRGNGTPEIEIATDKIDPRGKNVTIKVTIKGLPPDCPASGSDMFGVIGNFDIFPIDEYGELSLSDEKQRIAYAAIMLKREPEMVALYILRGPKSQLRKYFDRRIQKISTLLKKPHDTDMQRVVFGFSDADRLSTQIFLLPRKDAESFPYVEYDLQTFRPKR